MEWMTEISEMITGHIMVFTFVMILLAVKILFIDGNEELTDEDDKV